MMSFILNGILIVLFFPPVFNRLFGLEQVRDYAVGVFRGLLWLIVAGIFIVRLDGITFSPILEMLYIAVQGILVVEILLRAFIKFGMYVLPVKRQFLERIKNVMTDASLYGGLELLYEPHPFLHFTLPRRKLEDGDIEIGFEGLKLSDIPKPANTIRVACVGNSTLKDYPRLLEQFMNQANLQSRFQVLNFGIPWWSSLHSTVNYILNVIEFNPDYVVIHDNCNDHNYRGYPGLRGDAAHAYQPYSIPTRPDVFWMRLLLIYRLPIIFMSRKFPKFLKPHFSMEKIILGPGKKYTYYPHELHIFDRNIDTIYAVSKHRNIKLCLMTFPFSNVLNYGEEHSKVYRPHMREVNEILRTKAAQYGLILIDAEKLMTGEEELFWDPVHVQLKGDRIKSYLIGCKILEDLAFPVEVTGEWQEIRDWVRARGDSIPPSKNSPYSKLPLKELTAENAKRAEFPAKGLRYCSPQDLDRRKNDPGQ
jgi:hypothetical protein